MSETRDKIIASIIASPENAADAFINLQNEYFELGAKLKAEESKAIARAEMQQSRIDQLESIIDMTIDDLLGRSEMVSDGRRVVNISAQLWIKLHTAVGLIWERQSNDRTG